jgi:hypothetical protein
VQQQVHRPEQIRQRLLLHAVQRLALQLDLVFGILRQRLEIFIRLD